MPDDNYDTINRELTDQHNRINALDAMLRRVVSYAATVRDENTPEWIQGMADLLNEAENLLDDREANR